VTNTIINRGRPPSTQKVVIECMDLFLRLSVQGAIRIFVATHRYLEALGGASGRFR